MPDNRARHVFLKVDTDSDPNNNPANGSSVQAAQNVWFEAGFAQAARGNELVGYSLPEGDNTVVGCCEDNTGGLLYFVANSGGHHQLVRFTNGACSLLLEHEALHLSPAEPVLGAVVLDGLLIYRDAAAQLRAIPLDATARAAAVATLPTDPYALHLVHQPPHVTPSAVRAINSVPNDPRTLLNQVAPHAWQFALQYEYPSGERTPLGSYSDVLPVDASYTGNNPQDERNVVTVTVPAGGLGPSPLVRSVRLLVRSDGDPTWLLAGEITPGVPFTFYGTTTGEAIAAADAAKLSEALPLGVGCMTVARSRIFVGDCLEGYAPTTTSPFVAAQAGGAVTPPADATVYKTDTQYHFVELGQYDEEIQSSAVRTAYFTIVTGEYPDPDSTYRQVTEREGVYYAVVGSTPRSYASVFVDLAEDEDYREITVLDNVRLADALVAPPTATASTTMRDRSVYTVGVAYFDALGRTAGAGGLQSVLVPALPTAAPFTQNLAWALPATLRPTIPAWAHSYSVLLSPNRTVSRYVQFYVDSLSQYRGDNADGSPILVPLAQTNTVQTKALWVPLARLIRDRRGYTYEAGDRLRFPELTTGQVDWPILYVRGEYVAISSSARDLFITQFGVVLRPDTPLIELYTPSTTADLPVLYEASARFAIDRPADEPARFTVTSGAFPGDSTFQIGGYTTMNTPYGNDGLWLDATQGRAIPVLKEGAQLRRASLLRYSGVKVQGTRLNGLGIWDATAQDDLPQEQGAIVRLVVADQTQADGSLLLAVQERGAESRYLGQSVVTQGDGATTLALTKGVLGGGNALRGGYGCAPRHAASVVAYAGRVFWYCDERQEVVRYAQNGVTPLGLTYRFRARLSAVARQYGSVPAVGGYDPRRDEYWLTFPGFFVLRGQTLAWNERRETWVDSYEAQPECMGHAGNQFVSFQNGQLWQHSPNAPFATFFGQRSPASLTFTASVGAGQSKLWKQVEVESETGWLPTRLTIERGADTPMQSRMSPEWLRYLEGVWRGAFRRDENSPGGLLGGRPLIGDTLRVTLTAPVLPTPLTAVSIGFQLRPGRT